MVVPAVSYCNPQCTAGGDQRQRREERGYEGAVHAEREPVQAADRVYTEPAVTESAQRSGRLSTNVNRWRSSSRQAR